MLWFLDCSSYFLVDDIILVVCGISRTIRAVNASFLFMRFCLFVSSLYNLQWVQKYWSAMRMSRHESAGLLKACVNVVDCCDPSSTCTLTCVKMIETCVESGFTTISE
jgi:hypothetical protein